MPRNTKRKYYQEPLFDELRRDTCYVCYERIKKDEGIYIGNNLWRHKKCKPGGRAWLKNKIGQTPDSRKLFGPEVS